MKKKKSDRSDLENKKSLFFITGIVVSLSCILFAFHMKIEPVSTVLMGTKPEYTDEYINIPVLKEKEPDFPKEKFKVQLINIVGNETEVDGQLDVFIDEAANEPVFDLPVSIAKPADKPVDEEIFINPEFMPEFPGGDAALLTFLSRNIKYPVIAQENGITGRIFVSFIINENGEIYDATISRGVHPLLDAEALRVVNLLPDWKPGRQGGKVVKVRYSVPIYFELR